MSIRISAIICTLNRSAYLKKAVQSLIDQTLPEEQYEAIVVDNASTDDTKAVIEGFRHVQNLRYIYEPILGLSQARNTGWQNAEGKYIAYLDDDAIACPEWLERIVHAFETVKPTPGSVGGKITLIWEAERPKWLAKELESSLGYLDWGDSQKFLAEDHQWLGGGNVAYPREVLNNLGGFSTSLGRKGTNLLSGDEIFLRDRLKERNLNQYYDPDIMVQHHALADRLNKNWFYKRHFWGGISYAVLQSLSAQRHKQLANILRFIRSLAGVLVHLLMSFVSASPDRRMMRKCSACFHLGVIWEQTRSWLGLSKV